ncbi:hypothetical protein Lal_00017405 [Lupinus albus]|nr:hypothetical protein Lal_00017405 [Lupinus albus]
MVFSTRAMDSEVNYRSWEIDEPEETNVRTASNLEEVPPFQARVDLCEEEVAEENERSRPHSVVRNREHDDSGSWRRIPLFNGGYRVMAVVQARGLERMSSRSLSTGSSKAPIEVARGLKRMSLRSSRTDSSNISPGISLEREILAWARKAHLKG